MIRQFTTKRDVVGAFANAMNLISPEVQKHHEKVSYLACRLAEAVGMNEKQQMLAFSGGLLHDVGGYPFHLPESELSLGSRIMTVADIFSALTEERPYRKSMDKSDVISILRGDAQRGQLLESLVELLVGHYDLINGRRAKESRAASKKYQESLAGRQFAPESDERAET